MMRQQPPFVEGPPPDDVVELLEERLVVDKRKTVTGRVKVQVTTETIEELVTKDLLAESIEITRVPMDRTVAEIPDIRVEGDVTIMSVVEEFLFVETRLRLKEEVHIRRRRTQDTVEVPMTLKRQSAAIERTEPEER